MRKYKKRNLLILIGLISQHFTLCCSILCCKYKKPKKVKASGSSIVAVLYFEATDWQTYKEIKTEVRKIIAESKQYDKKYKDLEFTAISVEEYNGSSHDVLKYCLKALKMDGSDDNVTTIELKVKRYCENGVRTYIPEAFTCVYNYSLDNSKQNFYTENINLTIRTIKIKDMDDFEMVHRNSKGVNVLNNQIHKSFINCLRSKIENEITAYTNRHLYVLITKHLIQKIKKGKHCDAEKIICDGNEYLQFRYNLFESSAKKEFIILAVDNIYTAISSTKEEMFEKIVEEVAKKVPIFQPNIECNYSKIGITRERVRYFYSQGFKNILLNYLRIGLDKILKKLEKLDVARLNSAYTKYVLWLKEKNIATEILPHQNRPENLVEEYRISNGESILEIAAFIEICRIGSVDNINYSGSLLKLKSTFHTSRAKIILRGKLTKNTIPTMCHILCHIPTPIDSVFQQIICINLNQSIDLNWVLDENKEIVIKENNKTGCSIHVGYCILKSNILMKKKDQIKVYKSTINTNNSREKTEAISKVATSKDNNFTYDIQNLQKVMFGNKRVKFELHVKKNYTDRLGAGNTVNLNNRRKIIKICISSNLKLIKLEIKTSKDDQCINLRQKSFDIVTRKELMDIKYAGKFFKKKVDFLFDIKHPIRLVQYLKSIQALSYSSDIPVVDYHKKTELFIDNFAIPIAGESPSNFSDLVRENLSKIQKSIRDAYQKNKNSQTFALEIQLSDYLTQKIYPDKWIAIVGEFLRISGISLEFLDVVLSKFIIDTTVFEASCENDVHGIDTSNFTIIIVAKHICGCEPVIYMMMSLLTCDFGYMPMARILDFYCYVLKDTVYREKTHPLNSLGALTKAPKHPITYIFIVLFDPLSNLLKILDMESCYDTNIEIYKEVSEKILQCMRQDLNPSDTAKDRLSTSENMEPLDSIKLQEILSHEVFLMVERIKKYQDRVNSRTLINVAVFSRDPSTRIDNEIIEELESMLVKT